jgi:hypothetical protein
MRVEASNMLQVIWWCWVVEQVLDVATWLGLIKTKTELADFERARRQKVGGRREHPGCLQNRSQTYEMAFLLLHVNTVTKVTPLYQTGEPYAANDHFVCSCQKRHQTTHRS